MTAPPRGSFARAQALVADVCRKAQLAGTAIDTPTLKLVQVVTSAALIVCAGFELWLSGRPSSLLLLAAAVLLGLAAWRQPHADSERHTMAPAEAPRGAAGLQSEIILQLAAQHTAERKTATSATLSHQAWGDLMARVSHDLRTPLNAVIGFSDVMGSELFGPVGDHRYREYIAHIRDSGRELLKSAEDTLAITSLLGANQAGSGDAIDLEALAVEAARAAGTAAIDIDVEDGLDVIGERRALRQALVNLVSEATLRCSGGQSARLSATCEEEFVIVQVAVSGSASRPAGQEASLHICMARVLLELQGARLIEIESDGQWQAVTVLGRASQQDFFAAGSVPMGWRPTPQAAMARLPS